MSAGATEECAGHGFACIDIFRRLSIIFIILLGIILISFLFEKLVESSLRWVKQNALAREIRSHLVKEFMVLGFISFCLFFVTYAIELNPTETAIAVSLHLIFEFVHMSIFISTVLFMMIVVYLSKFVSMRMKLWEKWELTPINQVEEEYALAEARWLGGFLVCKFWRTEKQKMRYYFHTIRTAFLKHREDISDDHRKPDRLVFSRYLQHCVGVVLLFVVQVGWKVWALFLGLVGAGVILREVYFAMLSVSSAEQLNPDVNGSFFYGMYMLGYLFMFLTMSVKRKCLKICKILHKSIAQGDHLKLKHEATGLQRQMDRDTDKRFDCLLRSYQKCCVFFCRRERHVHPVIEAFPFRSPNFIVRFFQVAMMFQAFQMSTWILVFVYLDHVNVWFQITFLIPTIHFTIFYAPTALQYYCVCRFVGPLTSSQAIEAIISKTKPIQRIVEEEEDEYSDRSVSGSRSASSQRKRKKHVKFDASENVERQESAASGYKTKPAAYGTIGKHAKSIEDISIAMAGRLETMYIGHGDET